MARYKSPKSFGTMKPPGPKWVDGIGTAGTMKNFDARGQASVNSVSEKDIRTPVTQGNCFTPSSNKQLERDWNKRNFNHGGEVKQDDQLHSDTTMPGDTMVNEGQAKGFASGDFVESAKEQLRREDAFKQPVEKKTRKDVELTS